MTIGGVNLDGLGVDTSRAQFKRALLGGLYGLLAGTAFVLVAAFIDIWLHPDLPLAVNWSAFALRMAWIGLGLALVGGVTCWWQEAWQGWLSGAVLTSALALIAALVTSQVDTGARLVVLIFILVPVAAMTLPVAYILRWLAERHANALYMSWRGVRIAGLVLLVIALGAGPGYFVKSSEGAIESARFIHNLLQDLSVEKNPLAGVAGVPERRDTAYQMYPTPSETSTEGFDIHVQYADHYNLLCTVIAYPERSPSFSGCQAGVR